MGSRLGGETPDQGPVRSAAPRHVPAGDSHVCAGRAQGADQLAEHFGRVLEVSVHRGQQIAARELPAVYDCRRESQASGASEHAHGELRRQRLRKLGGSVCARVVNHDQLERLARSL